MQFIAQGDERRKPVLFAFRDFVDELTARPQLTHVDQLAAHFRKTTRGTQQRGEFFWRQRLAVADEYINVEFEPILARAAVGIRFGRPRRDGDIDLATFAPAERGKTLIEPHFAVFPRRQQFLDHRCRAVGGVQRESVVSTRDETGIDEPFRESVRNVCAEAHEFSVHLRDRAVNRKRRARIGRPVDECQTCEQRAIAPGHACEQRRFERIAHAERLAFVRRQKRGNASDRRGRRRGTVGRRLIGRGEPCCGDDFARIETRIEQVGDAIDDQPSRRAIQDEGAGGFVTASVTIFEGGNESRAAPRGAQPQSA